MSAQRETMRLDLNNLARFLAPYGARSGRDARGPSEEHEWFCDSSEN